MTGKLISICPELCFPLAGFMMQNIPESSDSSLHVQSSHHPLVALMLFGPFLAMNLRFQQVLLLIEYHLPSKDQHVCRFFFYNRIVFHV